MKRIAWKTLTGVFAMGAAWAARQAATALFTRVSDTETPLNPADTSVRWSEALGWAALAGLSAGLARVVAKRGAAEVWTAMADEPPPGLDMR